jgi:hypothetical protein
VLIRRTFVMSGCRGAVVHAISTAHSRNSPAGKNSHSGRTAWQQYRVGSESARARRWKKTKAITVMDDLGFFQLVRRPNGCLFPCIALSPAAVLKTNHGLATETGGGRHSGVCHHAC